MRLLQCLQDDVFVLTSFDDERPPPPYAILSHTWVEGQEVTYNDVVAGEGKNKSGYDKLRFCGEQAAVDGIQYFWVDTCCIDKSTSNELSTAINSMFRWYQRAVKCYVYLSDVTVPEDIDAEAFPITWTESFRRSRWFTRGWTLQELLAPPCIEFFSREGKRLGSRTSLEVEIHEVTTIPIEVLRGQSFGVYSIKERMRWAATRKTTFKEDKVYCLLGIFGVFLPLIYGEGEEYATQRLEEEIVRRQKGQGTVDQYSLAASPSLPFPRNKQFVGREDQLESLKKTLFSLRTHSRMTIYGLGGCGKSALALEFAYRTLTDRDVDRVFWVPAMSRDSFKLAYREIAISLRISGMSDDNADINKLVKDKLSTNSSGNWLMIVDNADDPTVLSGPIDGDPKSVRLSDFLPKSHQGTILFTTRSRKAARTLTPDHVLGLQDMSQAEARQLLLQRITDRALLNDSLAVEQLLSILACLPLAIVQAAAFINSNEIPISKYVSLFEHPGTETELFSERFEDSSRYQSMDSTIAKTWYISFAQIRTQDPLAAKYLAFIACIDRINIPHLLLPSGDSRVQEVKALGTLTGYAFLTERQQTVQGAERERYFDMHRLVHIASIIWLQEQGAWASSICIATNRLLKKVPYGGHLSREVWIPYIPHALHIIGYEDLVEEVSRAALLDRVARCQESLGQYASAEASHRQELSLREKLLGHENRLTLNSMSNLAWVLDRQGKYEEAEVLVRHVLAQREKLLRPEHPDTLTSMTNFAFVLSRQGKYEEAEVIIRQTLPLREKVLGPEHPDTLTSMNNLALALGSQGRYEEAEAINRQTLARHKKVRGSQHPWTLLSMSNLAVALIGQEKYEEAEIVLRETLEQRLKVQGPEHPDTRTEVNGLALVLDRQGRYDEQELITRENVERLKEVLGPEHPDTLMSMSNLALVIAPRKHEEAESIYRQTLVQMEKLLGPEHPATLTSMSNLALLLAEGKHEEAELIYRQNVERREKVLGHEHTDTLASVYGLAYLLANQRRYVESHQLYERACTGYTKVLGADNPITRACRQHYTEATTKVGYRQRMALANSTKPNSRASARKEGLIGQVILGLSKIRSKVTH